MKNNLSALNHSPEWEAEQTLHFYKSKWLQIFEMNEVIWISIVS